MEVIIDGVIYAPKGQTQQTWVDPETNLEWHWETKKLPWKDAFEYAKSLGDGWRVPTVHELISLVDYSLTDNVTKTSVPIKTAAACYWTALPYANEDEKFAWFIYFRNGRLDGSYKSHSYYVRCVRGEMK